MDNDNKLDQGNDGQSGEDGTEVEYIQEVTRPGPVDHLDE